MCNNYPNCNCPSCTQCQDCTQVTPTCNCTTTCTCSSEQFTEECPSGLQSTNCLIYTGDNLQNCAGDDYLFRGTNFNDFLSQLWDTVKCAATPSTTTVEYDGANIRNCDNTAIVVATGSSLTTALNNIWNAVKCWYTDLEELISERQPVWQGSATITIGVSQPAPFNNINTAIVELSKYHFNDSDIILKLETGTYTVSSEFQFGKLLLDKNVLYVESLSGVKEDVTIKGSITQGVDAFSAGYISFSNLTLASENNAPIIGLYAAGAHVYLTNVKITNNSSSSTLFNISQGASLQMNSCTFVDSNTANTSPFIYAERQGNVTISGGAYTVNRYFFVGRNASLYVTGSSVDFTNPSALALFVLSANSTGNIINTPIRNGNSGGPQSTAFLVEQSTLYVQNIYNVVTNCIENFQTAFNVTANSTLNIYNENNNSRYVNKYFCVTQTSEFNMYRGQVTSFNYSTPTLGVYNVSSKVRLSQVSMEANRVINSWNNADSTFDSCTFIFNTTYALANPTQSRIYIWEDNGNTSTFYNCTLDLNNLSEGIRSSINGTQFWTDSSNFINVPGNARLIADFNSIIYAPLVTGITKFASTNSLIY
jgi:hypothetical protein